MSNNNDRYAVFGNPINHSKSPILQMAFAEQTQQNISYTAECINTDQFSQAADEFFSSGGKGLNVTVPFKIDAFNYADTLTERAKKAGAVNTLSMKNNQVIGDNTDGVGFVTDVLENLQWTLKNKNILIMGAGGAVRGILGPLLQSQPKSITIANRTIEKAETLAEIFNDDGTVLACKYSDLQGSFDIIINGTSTSLSGKLPDLPNHLTNTTTCCYDLMYAKEETIFMQWGKQQGAFSVADGLGMLVCQGAESFYQWRGIRPSTASVITQLKAFSN